MDAVIEVRDRDSAGERKRPRATICRANDQGVIDDVEFENATTTIMPGQTIVLYTDGISESFNPHREMFGVRGIERALHECSGEPACVVKSITESLKEHEAGERPSDDQTIVAVKVE